MTTDEIQTALTVNSQALRQATDDAALYERLKAAASTARRLREEGTQLTAALSDAMAAEEKAAREAFAAKIKNLRVDVSYPYEGETTLLGARFTIRWEAPAWDSSTRTNPWTSREAISFDELRIHYPDVYRLLVTERSDALPSMIRDIPAASMEDAVDRYIVAKRRGTVNW